MSKQGVNAQITQDLKAAYENEADALFRFVFFRTRDRERALDIVQDTFLRVWRTLSEGKEVDALRAYLFRTARNLIIDNARKDGYRDERSLDAFLDEGGDIAEAPREFIYDPLDLERAVQLLSELEPPEYREVLHLRFIEELAPKEIADILGVSENVVSVRINRATRKLGKQFTAFYEHV